MTQDQIMKLVDAYSDASYASGKHGDVGSAIDTDKARAAIVAALDAQDTEHKRVRTKWQEDYTLLDEVCREATALEAQVAALTKDAERYRVGREAEYAGLMPTFIRPGRTWADAMDSAYDAAIAASKEQV